jgi:hypothetical protein
MIEAPIRIPMMMTMMVNFRLIVFTLFPRPGDVFPDPSKHYPRNHCIRQDGFRKVNGLEKKLWAIYGDPFFE